MTQEQATDHASLEGLVETGMLPLESLHPGGLDTTRQLAELCEIERGTEVLDVASGTGESACFLAASFGARVLGIDHSDEMVQRAAAKARTQEVDVEFITADAASPPFDDSRFDVAICECTLCFLDKARVLSEMVRVVRPGGFIGMHDLYWKEGASEAEKLTLAEIEAEKPETLEGWRRLFEGAGLEQISTIDKSAIMSRWMSESRKQLGLAGQLMLALKIIRRWGFGGAWRVFRSERVFSSGLLGYAIVVGRKPALSAMHGQET
ncbi:class I SAM-dependent methyltransferase [Microbulbifer hainanensis]|uniref:class I SAM-dependent methyltransferase n=1 Tax=Microbulbifer hainanensis TaxID=2735675 RepID=UPI0018683381|nr:class I SAM-dependent methyltransferase [Microbulbifer hainanensis]